ncbi:hypothetical protein LCGC14_0730150, partial [marine sediment metagenome]
MGLDTLAIITSFAVLVALFGQKFWEWWSEPQITFSLKNEEPHIVTDYGGYNWTKYFRLKVINGGRTTAKNCQIKILSVVPISRQLNLPLIEPDKLKWSSAPLDSRYSIHREKLDISPYGGWEFCDLFRLESTNLVDIKFQSLGMNREVSIREEYIITIEISGDNFKPRIAHIRTINPQNGFWNIHLAWAMNTSQLSSDYTQEPSEV